ncbi:hypothetical protein BGZ92_005323, partial [Podila epicladia]
MLDVICALSYYFSSLKRQEMVPKLLPVIADAQQTCPGLFPPYPKTRLGREAYPITLWDVIQEIKNLDAKNATLFDEFLLQEVRRITPQLQTALAHAIQKLLPKEVGKFSAENLDKLVLLLINHILEEVSKLKEALFSTEVEQARQKLEADQIKAKEEIERLQAMRLSLREQHDAIVNQTSNEEDDITSQTRELEQLINQQRQEIEQVSIPSGKEFVFEGVHYRPWAESQLKKAMHRTLDEKSAQALQQLPRDIRALWRERREAAYRQTVKIVDEGIANAGSALKEIKAKLASIGTMREAIHTNPSHQEVAQAIGLGLSAPVKQFPTLASTDDTHL